MMQRIQEKSVSFIGVERMRLNQLLEANVSDQKRREINQRLNILSAFHVIKDANHHTEL